MANSSTGLTEHSLNQLLDWLDQDRDRAARRYEKIRSRLIRIFTYRGCAEPEELADETIDRVAAKVHQIVGTYVGDPAFYFYGVASKVYLEYVKKAPAPRPPAPDPADPEIDLRYQCLEGCMDRLLGESRLLILGYYEDDGKKKIKNRKELAARFGLGANALWIRAHRIREGLRRCVSECFQRTNAGSGEHPFKEAN